MIEPSYIYELKSDFLKNPIAIEFEITKDKIEFLKQLFQILGMYNFIINGSQSASDNNGLQVRISGPNGPIFLEISEHQRVSILAHDNARDLLIIRMILNKFSVFKAREPLSNFHKEKRALQMQDSL